jgi:exonuclease SbcC
MLGINKDGNFIVKDNLNSGKIRLLKTLSGGQIFQASFCIALALAESINIVNKQSNNFFFIDEGFGSLDKDSLKLVFNTLNTLRYEKRIVGVISHVEDFKREVDISINVNRDKKYGSIIKTSW